MSWLDTTPAKDGCDVIWLKSSGSLDNRDIDCGKVLELEFV